jgi:hypothetical protein
VHRRRLDTAGHSRPPDTMNAWAHREVPAFERFLACCAGRSPSRTCPGADLDPKKDPFMLAAKAITFMWK